MNYVALESDFPHPDIPPGDQRTDQDYSGEALGSYLLGLGLALLRLSRFGPVRSAAWTYIWFIRGTPQLLQLVFLYDALPSVGRGHSGCGAGRVGPEGQRHPEQGTTVSPVPDLDASTVPFDELLRDGEPETGSAEAPCRAVVPPTEPLEDRFA